MRLPSASQRARLVVLVVSLAATLAGCGGVDASPLGTTVEAVYTDGVSRAFTDLEVTVLAVRTGTIDELESSGLEFDPEEQALVPHYVDVRYANVGDTPVPRTMGVSLEDSDDNLINPTIVFNFSGADETGGPCPDEEEGVLEPGAEFEDCTLFLVDPGRTVARVTFFSQPPEGEAEFIGWQATE